MSRSLISSTTLPRQSRYCTAMRRITVLPVLVCGLAALADNARAQFPYDTVQSDDCTNTAMGSSALYLLKNPADDCPQGSNTAAGDSAMFASTKGSLNSAYGVDALYSNAGNSNSAFGFGALFSNTSGEQNTAVGSGALSYESTGSNNTAVGVNALEGPPSISSPYTFLTGSNNTATGVQALNGATSGSNNTADGADALKDDTSGSDNTADGVSALHFTKTGGANSAFGYHALYANTSGSGNIAIGYGAGAAITGSYNIDIGADGVSGESGVLRIGTSSQKQAFIAGIYDTSLKTGSLPVYVDSAGQLSVSHSSERYKTTVAAMGRRSDKLRLLRPVSFHLKSDPLGTLQYGLIAEEVEKVYPELVVRDDAGVIQGVRYDELAPMLLNELQQQTARQRLTDARQRAQTADMQRQLAELRQANRSMQAAIEKLAPHDAQVAMQ